MKYILKGDAPPAGLQVAHIDEHGYVKEFVVVELDEHNQAYVELDSEIEAGHQLAESWENDR